MSLFSEEDQIRKGKTEQEPGRHWQHGHTRKTSTETET